MISLSQIDLQRHFVVGLVAAGLEQLDAAVLLQLGDLGLLDGILDREVRSRFHGVDIATQVPEFADGKLIPTGENLARFVFERVASALTGTAKVVSVVVREE